MVLKHAAGPAFHAPGGGGGISLPQSVLGDRSVPFHRPPLISGWLSHLT